MTRVKFMRAPKARSHCMATCLFFNIAALNHYFWNRVQCSHHRKHSEATWHHSQQTSLRTKEGKLSTDLFECWSVLCHCRMKKEETLKDKHLVKPACVCVCVCVFQIISEISKKVAQIQNGKYDAADWLTSPQMSELQLLTLIWSNISYRDEMMLL